MSSEVRCLRCRSTWNGSDDWNVVFKQGRPQYYLCTECQSAEENAEAAINEATLDYAVDSFGLPIARPKTLE